MLQKASIEELELRLEETKESIRQAVRDGDEASLIKLRAKADVLPVQIIDAKIAAAEAAVVSIEKECSELQRQRTELGSAEKEAWAKLHQAEAALRAAKNEVESAEHRGSSIHSRITRKSEEKQAAEKCVEELRQALEDHLSRV